MTVVSDTTAITNLYNIGRLQLLKDVFGHIAIPLAVRQELSEIPEQLALIAQLDFIEVMSTTQTDVVATLKAKLDDGEAEAISLAVELNADFLVIDEWKGRRVAKEMGVQVIGLVGILLTAKRKGIIPVIHSQSFRS
jgi:predicted nucleic acid-binding protein